MVFARLKEIAILVLRRLLNDQATDLEKINQNTKLVLYLGANIIPLTRFSSILLKLDLFIFACLEVLRKTDCFPSMELQMLDLTKLLCIKVFQPIMGWDFFTSIALVVRMISGAPSFLGVFSGTAVMRNSLPMWVTRRKSEYMREVLKLLLNRCWF